MLPELPDSAHHFWHEVRSAPGLAIPASAVYLKLDLPSQLAAIAPGRLKARQMGRSKTCERSALLSFRVTLAHEAQKSGSEIWTVCLLVRQGSSGGSQAPMTILSLPKPTRDHLLRILNGA